ncbi:hypothetical protein [Sphingomonas sp. BAUL-RG-20F-R05-02]|uniref:hypothetical protein n=1 Tax=Sphingomonas sp. BAUL-RG-20F-R05-02 TaxID=2914830 RepID=UPI001F5AA0C3|nr:hypothetical protein [Sphingomonas sp. BAUL-RG-20F-R05-02]
MFRRDPVGRTGKAMLTLGFVAFLVLPIAARVRAGATADAAMLGRRNTSWLWIDVQGLGIAWVAAGPITMKLDPLSFEGWRRQAWSFC